MESEARYTLVGIVVVLLAVLTAGFAIWLYRAGGEEPTRRYAIYYRNVSVAGLQIDSAVTIRGIKVGRVFDINMSTTDVEAVRVEIDVKRSTPVKSDTRAVVVQSLVTGVANIDLVGGTQGSPPFDETRLDPQGLPIIPQGETQFQAVAKSLPEVLANVNNLTQSLSRLAENAAPYLSEENRRTVSELLKNLTTISAAVSERSPQIKQALGDAVELIAAMRKTAETIHKQANPLVESVRNATESISREMRNMAYDVRRAADSVSNASGALENPREAVFGPRTSTFGPAERPNKGK